MSIAEADTCTSCGAGAVTYDNEGSCYVCESCGHVSEAHGLAPYQDAAEHPQRANPVGGQAAVTAAYSNEVGQPIGGAPPLASYGPGVEAAARCVGGGADRSRAQRQRRALDDLQSLAATLRLPGPTTQLAAGFLARLHQAAAEAAAGRHHGGGAEAESEGGGEGDHAGVVWDSENDGDDAAAAAATARSGSAASDSAGPVGPLPTPAAPPMGGQQSAARLGALLYLAARSERGTLTLAEVAAATATDMYRVGEIARQQASFLRLPLPAVDVERFVVRIARELVASGALQQQQQQRGSGCDGGGQGGRAGGDGPATAVPAAPAPASETAVWSHPLVRRALLLSGLVVRRAWHEGRTPRTVAGALLSICLDSLYPQRAAGGGGGGGHGGGWGGGSLTVAQLSRAAMCAESQLWDLKQEIVGQLLRLASLLPFGPLVSRSNVAAYLDVIVAAEAVVEGMQAQQQ